MKPHRWTSYIILLVLMQIYKGKGISSCGQLQTTLVPRIMNSYETHRWPWHVAVYHRCDESKYLYKCGGTLISSEIILTSAHCVAIAPHHILVSLGRFTLDESESRAPRLKITKVIQHPNYNWGNPANDIAIIQLSTSAIFNNYVQPICLWKATKTDLSEVVGESGTVVGWGLTETGEVSNELRQASLPVIDFYTCLASNSGLFGKLLSNTSYCAGTQNGTSVCSGDSGRSMTFEENGVYYIRGIVSLSPSKMIHKTQKTVCDATQYAVFTDVAQHLTWINETASTMICPKEVHCGWSVAKTCSALLTVGHFSNRCKIIFDESNTFVKFLLINKGQSDGIPDLSDAVEKFESLESLHLEKLKIKMVRRVRLTTFRKIKFLSLSSNEITQFDADTFTDLGNLTDLSLYSNKLSNLSSDLFKELIHLETLRLNDNNLERLPASIFQNSKNIRRIYLGKNQLTELDANIFRKLGNLEVLYLEENQLEAIPAVILKEIGNIVLLNLHSNKIRTLPSAIFSNNMKLRGLDLSKNQLTELDVDLFNELSDLEILNLNENQLEALPAGLFNENLKLRKINFENNKLTKVETNFYHSTQYAKLNFRGNVCIDAECGIAEDCDVLTSHNLFDNLKRNC